MIHGPALASLFETYINHDIRQADAVQVQQPNLVGRPPLPDLFVPDTLPPNLAALAGPRFFNERVVNKELTVQPLMTPDNYIDFVLPLIEGAREKLYFQNQSLKPNSSNARYTRLFRALRDKSRDPNVDVRILVRGDFSASTILSTLQASGFEMSRVRLQNGNHNKGILIDEETTVLGSHNWTGDGTTFNRDASLIFNDREIFDYYEGIFLYDWENLSRSDALELLDMPRLAPPGEEPPPGWVRVAWADLFPE